MLASVIVGIVFAGIITFASRKVYLDAKNNKCSCGTTCSEKSKCHVVQK